MNDRRPIIGLTAFSGMRLNSIPVQTQHLAYVTALIEAGAAPVILPLTGDHDVLSTLLGQVDGICFPGGPDLSPTLYGEDARQDCAIDGDALLDVCELEVMKIALHRQIPMLCICRGMQLLNVVCGGTLWQDLITQHATPIRHDLPRGGESHHITLAPWSELHAIAETPSVTVNTLHHQGVRDLGDGLWVTATAEDGLIEGVERSSGAFTVGVQFHPEELTPPHRLGLPLFRALVEEAGRSTSIPGRSIARRHQRKRPEEAR